MSSLKKEYNTVVSQAKKGVPGFAIAYAKFIEKVTIDMGHILMDKMDYLCTHALPLPSTNSNHHYNSNNPQLPKRQKPYESRYGKPG